MFNAKKANWLMNATKNGTLDIWEKLQQEIRWRAYLGYDFMYLNNIDYYNLIDNLKLNEYDIWYDEEAKMYCCSWAYVID